MTPNELISFYSLAQSRDAYGTISAARTKIADAYARVRPLSGAERNAADQTEAYADYRFKIHYRGDLSAANVIVWNGVDYNIKFIADNGPKEVYMYIDAERGGAM
jgi:SPP1 family predicted phage head-tail adaptor